MINLLLGDCRKILKELEDNSVDAVVTDPPYELGSMEREWENTGIACDISMWKEVFRVLKSGSHVLSFGGSRTQHRMVCAIEDAGFEIRDTIMWIQSQGFPKGSNLKSAHEPICLARKPGKGNLNIEECRVPGKLEGDPNRFSKTDGGWGYRPKEFKKPPVVRQESRWPANIILSEEVADILNDKARFFYCAKASKTEKGAYNDHLTVKPIKLMQYLVKLVTPIDGVVLDPFMGSGTTGIAAKMEGFNFIGIEMREDYLEIAKKRLNDYQS